MEKIKLGYALCGSFCTLSQSIDALKELANHDIDITPIMSEIVYNTDTRFGKCDDIKEEIKSICKKDIIHTITEAEPIGPKKLFDILVVAPCTGNTIAKITNGITDTSVTMAVKAHLRNKRPVVIGISTNDGLAAAAKNIGSLENTKNIYLVPYGQDDPISKETSLVCDFTKIGETIEEALHGRQIKPLIIK